MRILLLIFLSGFTGFLIAQSDTLNQVDAEGKKQGHWIYYGKDYPQKGYPADAVYERGDYLNDRKHGWWYRYYKDGKTLQLKGEYLNNRPSGNFAKYYRNGNIKEEGTFLKGKYRGVHKKYHENGSLWSYKTYSNKGVEFGTTTYYYANGCKEVSFLLDSIGAKKMKITFRADSCNVPNDSLFFVEESYIDPLPLVPSKTPSLDPNDSWRNKDEYKSAYSDESVCQGDYEYRKMYNENDELLYDGNCFKGKVVTGKFYFYDSDGILVRIEIWKDSKYCGVGQL